MAIGLIQKIPGLTPETYDALNAEMGFPERVPEGLLSHAAGEADGGMWVVDVWKSRDHFDRFMKDLLMPASEKIGASPPESPPEIEEFEVHNRWSA